MVIDRTAQAGDGFVTECVLTLRFDADEKVFLPPPATFPGTGDAKPSTGVEPRRRPPPNKRDGFLFGGKPEPVEAERPPLLKTVRIFLLGMGSETNGRMRRATHDEARILRPSDQTSSARWLIQCRMSPSGRLCRSSETSDAHG